MRLIDADVLKQHIDKLPALPDGNFAGNHSALKALINMQPTIEPSTNCSEIPNNSDTVSRQQAIDALSLGKEMLSRVLDDIDVVGTVREKYSWGLGLIESYINDINNLPPAQPEHKVRFADKDHVWIDGKQYISLPRFQEAVKEAQPKEGHWIEVAGELECSECHTVFTDLYPDYADSVVCPHCGTKMTTSTK